MYEYEREAHPTISFVWITAAANHFVKLRLSMDPRLRDEVLDARRAVLAVVGEAIKPHLTPVDPDAKRPGSSLGINLERWRGRRDPGGNPVPGVAQHTGRASHPSSRRFAAAKWFPTWKPRLGVYRGVFGLDEELAASRLGKTIATIDKAGFLEEFLWTERHREAWGANPPREPEASRVRGMAEEKTQAIQAPGLRNGHDGPSQARCRWSRRHPEFEGGGRLLIEEFGCK